jgi:sterol desaturase/sphingolipid hydroxylase (fatty acid hydroxylase superfamily)
MAYIGYLIIHINPVLLSTFDLKLLSLIWVKNIFFLFLFAGTIHWWLYIRKSQTFDYKYYAKWPTENNSKFLFKSQVKDNMFWSLVSGCTIWTIYESVALWMQASGKLEVITWDEKPLYLLLCTFLMPFIGAIHFYIIHRILHFPFLYKIAHRFHHKNVNTGPWSGISMHPIEHLLYFSVIGIWFFIPCDPFVVVLTGIWFGVGPAQTHAGFNKLVLFKTKRLELADHFHHLHHKHFELNYGNIYAPIDSIFKSFHNGKIFPNKK